MNTPNQGDTVTLTGTVINTYINGTARIQLQPSLACYDMQVQDLTAAAAPTATAPLTAATTVQPRTGSSESVS